MTVKEILIAAKAKIDTPEKWAKNAAAYDEHGYPCDRYEGRAVSWCSLGAIDAVIDPCERHGTWWVREALRDIVGLSIAEWNDHPDRTHAEVMAAFDRAIEACNG